VVDDCNDGLGIWRLWHWQAYDLGVGYHFTFCAEFEFRLQFR
jgi:hypothetical protein